MPTPEEDPAAKPEAVAAEAKAEDAISAPVREGKPPLITEEDRQDFMREVRRYIKDDDAWAVPEISLLLLASKFQVFSEPWPFWEGLKAEPGPEKIRDLWDKVGEPKSTSAIQADSRNPISWKQWRVVTRKVARELGKSIPLTSKGEVSASAALHWLLENQGVNLPQEWRDAATTRNTELKDIASPEKRQPSVIINLKASLPPLPPIKRAAETDGDYLREASEILYRAATLLEIGNPEGTPAYFQDLRRQIKERRESLLAVRELLRKTSIDATVRETARATLQEVVNQLQDVPTNSFLYPNLYTLEGFPAYWMDSILPRLSVLSNDIITIRNDAFLKAFAQGKTGIGHVTSVDFPAPPKDGGPTAQALWAAITEIKAVTCNYPNGDWLSVDSTDPVGLILDKLRDVRASLENADKLLTPLVNETDPAPLLAVRRALKYLPQTQGLEEAWKRCQGDFSVWAVIVRPALDDFWAKLQDPLWSAYELLSAILSSMAAKPETIIKRAKLAGIDNAAQPDVDKRDTQGLLEQELIRLRTELKDRLEKLDRLYVLRQPTISPETVAELSDAAVSIDAESNPQLTPAHSGAELTVTQTAVLIARRAAAFSDATHERLVRRYKKDVSVKCDRGKLAHTGNGRNRRIRYEVAEALAESIRDKLSSQDEA